MQECHCILGGPVSLCLMHLLWDLVRYPRTAEVASLSGLPDNEAMLKTPICASQDCLANGKPLLIENIEEELDPVLDPVLEKRFIRQARGLTLQLNDKEVSHWCRDLSTPSLFTAISFSFHKRCKTCTWDIAAL